MSDVRVELAAPLTAGDSVAAGRETSREQFADLLAACWDRAFRFAYYLTGDRSDSEDLLQQAAEEALRAFPRFQPGTRFDSWLFRIIHNSYLDHVRKNRRRRVFSLDDLPADAVGAGADPAAVADGLLDGPVLRALQLLPPPFRAVVALVDLQGLSYEEAAAILRCPVGTVRSRLHRARLALREWLRPYVDAMKRGDL